LEADGCGMGDG
jgi:midasin